MNIKQKLYRLSAKIVVHGGEDSEKTTSVERIQKYLEDLLISFGAASGYLEDIAIRFQKEEERDLSGEKTEAYADEILPNDKGAYNRPWYREPKDLVTIKEFTDLKTQQQKEHLSQRKNKEKKK